MSKFASVVVIVKLPDDATKIPKEWFEAIPDPSYWASDIVEFPDNVTQDRLMTQLNGSAAAMWRKVSESGLPG